jgi:hypothetical protein
MYNSDSFEPVTKPASWSQLGSAGEDAIMSLEAHMLIQTHFDMLSF